MLLPLPSPSVLMMMVPVIPFTDRCTSSPLRRCTRAKFTQYRWPGPGWLADDGSAKDWVTCTLACLTAPRAMLFFCACVRVSRRISCASLRCVFIVHRSAVATPVLPVWCVSSARAYKNSNRSCLFMFLVCVCVCVCGERVHN